MKTSLYITWIVTILSFASSIHAQELTLDQVKAQAKRLIHGDRLIISIVGHPEGIKSTASGG